MAGGTVFAFILLGSLAAPLFTPFHFDAMDVMDRMHPPDAVHWLGTDEFGRDVLSRVLHGGSTSIGLGIAATAFAFAIGVPLGLLGGYIPGSMG
jgi:peptide/nickel transport system permease protein